MIGTIRTLPQRFPAAALAAAWVAASCGGGGGGGAPPNAPPILVTAAFVGGGAPAAGDTLILAFSETVTPVAGALLSDADVTLSGGASLGSVTGAPSQVGVNTLAVTLGSGVSIVPGTTTITLRTPGDGGAGNDVVRDATGQFGIAGTPVPIGTSDGAVPAIGNLTIASVDGALNGTGPAGGVLQVPANGWTLDLAYSDNTAIATDRTVVTASVPVATPGGVQPAGTDLRPFLTQLAAGNSSASYRVPADVTFPNGPLTLAAIVVDVSGLSSAPRTFAATVRAFTAALQPFETTVNPAQVWFLDFTRDIESFATSPVPGGFEVLVTAGANGRSDFEDLLRILGLTSATPLPNVQNGDDSNAVVIARFRAELLANLAGFYTGANVQFTVTPPGVGFGGSSSVPYGAIGHSRIAIAGASDIDGVLGVAIFDPNNGTQNDNTRTDFGGTRLGVFLHTIVDTGLGPPAGNAFRLTFDDFAPVLGGTPIGEQAADADRLTGVLADARANAIDLAIADLARFTAVVTAHECGHSMGLVQNGAMPVGLYGGDAVNFPGSSDGHIRNAALFPAGTNIMSPALSYQAAIHPATAFNSLNLAYLREQATYGN